MKKYFVILFLFSLFSFSQKKGQIIVKGKMMKAKSGKLYLYEVLGNDTFILDSTTVKSGTFQFKAKNYVTGFYKLAFNNETNNVEIVLNSKEGNVLDITFNEYRLSKNYKIPNSKDNIAKKLFNSKKAEIERNIKQIQRDGSKSIEVRKREVQKLKNNMESFSIKLSKEYPDTYTSMVLSKTKPVNEHDSDKFFDDINFNDESIIRSNLITNRIQRYMVTHVKYDPNKNKYAFYDAVDFIMTKAKVNERVAEFCMYNMLDGFYNTGSTSPDPMWIALCNYIIDEYFFGEACGEVEVSDLMKDRASKFKDLQVGNVPPDFTIKDVNNKAVNLKSICSKNEYTILVFWASHCTHCMSELPSLVSWYKANKNKDVEVVAVALDANKEKWKTTIDNNQFNWINVNQFKIYKSPVCKDYKVKKTPSVFILDRSMKIIDKPKDTRKAISFLNKKLN